MGRLECTSERLKLACFEMYCTFRSQISWFNKSGGLSFVLGFCLLISIDGKPFGTSMKLCMVWMSLSADST